MFLSMTVTRDQTVYQYKPHTGHMAFHVNFDRKGHVCCGCVVTVTSFFTKINEQTFDLIVLAFTSY
jgi:hypothetical protein